MATAICTEKGAPSLSTSGNPHVDLFFKFTQDAHHNPLFETWLEAAWAAGPLETMIILFNGRDCRGGKGIRDAFIAAMAHCIRHHTEWFAANVHNIPYYGRYLDWFDILVEFKDAADDIYPIVEALIVKETVSVLLSDMSAMSSGKAVSLLAKWLPSENKSYDRKLHIVRKICAHLFDMNVTAVGTSDLKCFRKTVVEPLRTYLNLVESNMCKGDWESIDFERVPSVAMKRLRKAFKENLPDLFREWCLEIGSGKSVVKAGQLYPHELVRAYLYDDCEGEDPVIEAQWKELKSRYSELEDTLVLSDVSGSMNGLPLEVSIAVGIFMATNMAEGPFQNKLITFHEEPSFHQIPLHCRTLYECVQSVKKMEWGGTTSFHKVFELILKCSKEVQMAPEDMPKRLVVLSDMQFDAADRSGGGGIMQFDAANGGNMKYDEGVMQFDSADRGGGGGTMQFDAADRGAATTFEYMRKVYAHFGYTLPEIVFWNLRSNTTRDFVVTAEQKGVAMVSGFSPSVLKNVLSNRDLSPENTLRQVLNDPRYSRIASP